MKAGVRVRRMSESDLDVVMAIAASLKDAPHWTRLAYVAAIDEESAPRRITLVAEDDGIVGFAVGRVVGPEAELESIAVAEREQGRGIGKYIFLALREELKAAGVREILLEVRASNELAQGFYRALGWNESGFRPGYYADPEEDAVLMSVKVG